MPAPVAQMFIGLLIVYTVPHPFAESVLPSFDCLFVDGRFSILRSVYQPYHRHFRVSVFNKQFYCYASVGTLTRFSVH